MELTNDVQITPPTNVTLYPAAYPGFILVLRICVGATSVLSIIGALGIIIGYTCFKQDEQDKQDSNKQTTNVHPFLNFRHIIVCVSIADILVACGHLWGVTTDLGRFYDIYYPGNNTTAPPPDQQCIVNASITFYGTMTSFWWTVILAMLVFALIKCQEKCAKVFFSPLAFTIYHLVGWVLPLIGNYILAKLKLLGYDKVDVGWCYIQLRSLDNSQTIAVLLLSYEVWAYLTFILLLFFSLGSCECKCYYNKHKDGILNERSRLLGGTLNEGSLSLKPATGAKDEREQTTRKKTIKLTVVVLMLIFLRSFTFVIDTFSYFPKKTATEIQHSWAMILLIFAGIGDSAQGIANAIVFLLFSKKFHKWIKEKCRCCKDDIDS